MLSEGIKHHVDPKGAPRRNRSGTGRDLASLYAINWERGSSVILASA